MPATSGPRSDRPPQAAQPAHLNITVEGIVQGVGFRPFIHRLASDLHLAGQVRNFTGGVEIDIEGAPEACRLFTERLSSEATPISVIERVDVEDRPVEGFSGFIITSSAHSDSGVILVSPDIATCDDCLRELADPADRRYLHPFINCTNCGPRYTIIRSMPYDRPATSMAPFPMCPDCDAEYHDITDRRYHAQPVACPNCGPTLWLEADGARTEGHEAIVAAQELLAGGKIVAIKGLGGFHLACDATNQEAVARLRQRKYREEKPLAVMVPDFETAEQIAHISAEAGKILQSPQTPIVLARKRLPEQLAHAVAPDSSDYGIMLPYTPVHHLIMRMKRGVIVGPRLGERAFTALVMTSGNISDEPLCIGNDEARDRLGDIADGFLFHDRDILVGCDDSVVRDSYVGPIVLRRARGHVPFPVRLGEQLTPVLALGGNMKNTVCLTTGNNAFISQHLGDLEDAMALEYFIQAAKHLMDIFQTRPQALACDLHPDYLSTRYGKREAEELKIPLIQSQHHHAHIVACMAENRAAEPVIGLACDGAGLGEDGTVWGCEVLLCNYAEYERLGHLRYVPLAGGDMAVKQPYRVAMAWLHELYGAEAVGLIEKLYPPEVSSSWPVFEQMITRDLNAPLASSAGRLFDAVSSLLDICQEATYEGQPAIMLEGIADSLAPPFEYPSPAGRGDRGEGRTESNPILDPSPLLRQVVESRLAGVAREEIAGAFHSGFVSMLAQAAVAASERTGLKTVALSGGTFANRIVVEGLAASLRDADLQVLLHRDLPPGDGCLSLGQAVIAHHHLT